jgi:hypothetical protein
MAQEVSLFGAFAPEFDSEGEGMDGLSMAADEGTSEVNPLQIVLFGLEVGDLAYVVTAETISKIWWG